MNVWKGTPNLLKLLQKIDREALKNERMIDCLLCIKKVRKAGFF